MNSRVKNHALDILGGPKSVIASAIMAAEATDDTDLAAACVRSAIASLEQAMVEATPLRARTAYLQDAVTALQSAQRELSRDWHHTASEDTVEGRALATYSLVTRLGAARTTLREFLGEEN